MDVTNLQRAVWGEAAFKAFCEAAHVSKLEAEQHYTITDCITDLLHFHDTRKTAKSVKAEQLLTSAQMNYEAEILEEDDEENEVDDDENTCDVPGCYNSLADGEGYDGKCGTCAADSKDGIDETAVIEVENGPTNACATCGKPFSKDVREERTDKGGLFRYCSTDCQEKH